MPFKHQSVDVEWAMVGKLWAWEKGLDLSV